MVVMDGSYKWYLIILACVVQIFASEDKYKNVVMLTSDNYSEFFKGKDVGRGIFVLFYSRDGSWSKIALKEYDKVGEILSKTNVKFGAMCPDDDFNIPVNIELVQLPTIFHIHGENATIYRGTITHVEMMNWVLLKVVKDLNINTPEALDSVLNVPKSHEALSLIVSKKKKFSITKFIENPSVIHLASLCIFFYIDSPNIIERLEKYIENKLVKEDLNYIDSGKSYVVVLRDFDYKSQAVIYKKSLDDLNSLVNFIKQESIPIMIDANSRMLPRLIEYEYKIIFIYTNDADLRKYVSLERIYRFVTDNRYCIVLVHLTPNHMTEDPIIRAYSYFIDMLGIETDSRIVVRAIWKDEKTGKIRKYQPQNFNEKRFDYKQFFVFMGMIVSNQLKPYFKTLTSIPKNIDMGPVKTIVGSDFHDRVMNSKDDVMLMIYATWCGHCHKLRPIWRQLGLLLQNVSNIIVAKLDGVNNEVDDIYISYFPTIRMYPHGQKSEPIDFKLDVTIENLLKFAEDNAGIAKFDTNKLIRSITPERLFEKSEL